ncbi:hypothetical protein SAY86_024804 [Trapa natans]|uniref:Uncharacterized protein n=1 Tax=Trapa natans TaxID=22666 RepID=A0AAN7M7A1_TRANT|nr:hypothetical protein SAY86_024804 [Trapa natans]
MAVASKTINMLEGLVRDSSFKWLLGNRASFDEEFEEMEKSPSAQSNWISELSPVANVVVRRCSKILGIPAIELQESFNIEASDSINHPSVYARNFLEYCCFRTLALSIRVTSHHSDRKLGRLTFDMMVAWESPAASSHPSVNLDEDVSVGMEAFSRIAPAVPLISNVVVSENLFDVLTDSTGGRLHFFVYEKYISGLERAIKRLKAQTESSLLSAARLSREEKILEMDGTVTTQPVLEHVGMSTWPGRLILTDHALYFEALRVVSFDKPKKYDLSEDLKQIVKPELTGPWGTRLFDKAVLYKSISLSEPVVMEFPELKGHGRRDYWLAIIREILYVHRFIRKFQIKGIGRDEILSKAVLGILRVQALQELTSTSPLRFETLLMFNLCDQLPGGDLILEALADMSYTRESERSNYPRAVNASEIYSVSSLAMISNLGFVFAGRSSGSSSPTEGALVLEEIIVGQATSLEQAVKESRNSYKKVAVAQATIDGVKLDGIDANMAVMKELLLPLTEIVNWVLSLFSWDDPLRSSIFCLAGAFMICREYLSYALALMFISIALFMILTKYMNHGRTAQEVKVMAPPPMNTVEQLLAVQTAIAQAERFIQDGNIVLLKLHALLMSIYPRASERLAVALLVSALLFVFLPAKSTLLMLFLEAFTRHSPPRKTSTERWMRRLREWWFSIPAAPVVLQREKDDKKMK